MSILRNSGSAGFGLGCVIAVALSWAANHSIIWAIIDGFFGWFYVIFYFVFKHHIIIQ